ncbi:glucosaminidase domain-containing protein [Patescibacteria group bacterium]|nr:glucosaminidase domain-containing protein [Patescibacteria group bacterium]
MRLGLLFSIIVIWIALASVILFVSSFFVRGLSSSGDMSKLLADSSRNLLEDSSSYNQTQIAGVIALINGKDVRPVLIDRFLSKYGSPMVGMGGEFVSAADRYGVDWRLLPAIAFQESNLGKKIPKNSYNPFGWAIYGGENTGVHFNSWSKGINIVAAKIKTDYINNGFTTPETIVTKYTSKNNSSWVFAVNWAMEEIAASEY